MQRSRESMFQAEGAACTKALRLEQPVQGEGGESGRGETSEAAAGQLASLCGHDSTNGPFG